MQDQLFVVLIYHSYSICKADNVVHIVYVLALYLYVFHEEMPVPNLCSISTDLDVIL